MTGFPQPETGPWTAYVWLPIVGAITAFCMAWGIGANDVANAFGTTVGAKTIKLWQACIIAAIFEFAGAISLGSPVTETMAGGIASVDDFKSVPEVFAFGMLCSLLAAWLWLTLATYLELAVSTTHSIIGAIMGFCLVYGGKSSIVWSQHSDTFPFVKGLMPVIISWFTSPVLAGLASALLFLANRTLVLRRKDSYSYAFWALPPLVLVTIYINTFFVLYQGAKDTFSWWSKSKMAWVAAAVAGGCAALSVPITWLYKHRHKAQLDKFDGPKDLLPELALSSRDWAPEEKAQGWWPKLKSRVLHPLTVDIHQDVHKSEMLATMHSAAEVFDPRTEDVYKFFQLFSSACVSFAHGSNDVANSVGPFAAIWYVYNNRAVAEDVPVPKWILALGGAGIVLGLGTYGYKIIKVLGVQMAKITPSRGFCAELATALTVSVASVYGLPISTTHCIVGAEAGLGIVENARSGTNWLLFAKTFCAWATTLIIAGCLSAGLFAFGSYSPSLILSSHLNTYEHMAQTDMSQLLALLNATNYANQRTLGRFDQRLDGLLVNLTQSLANVFNGGHVDDDVVQGLSTLVNELYLNNTLVTVGFNASAATNTSQAITVPA